MTRRVVVTLTIVKATNLPKTDRIGQIDPYVKVSFPSKSSQSSAKTSVIKDDPNPQWNQVFTFETEESSLLDGKFLFEIYDEDTFRDQKVASMEVHLNPGLFTKKDNEIPIEFVKEKYRNPSAVSVLGIRLACTYTFEAVMDDVKALPGVVCLSTAKRLYMPFPGHMGPLILGLEFEKSGEIDAKVYSTVQNPSLYLDMAILSATKSRIRRRTACEGKPTPIKGTSLSYYDEIKLDDVPIGTDWNLIALYKFEKELVEGTDLGKIVSAHGWKGSLNFQAAATKLQDVLLDHADQAVYFPLPSKHNFTTEDSVDPSTFIVVDWDQGNCDIKLMILDMPINAQYAYDLSITGTEFNKKTSDVYIPSKAILNGAYKASRRVELDDVPFGTDLGKMRWEKFLVKNCVEFRIGQLVRLSPF
ncbi:hypothetical protein DFS34DRAFT_622490 [Phlyctochytrium arcticum]|nr:hypothetical protein DFS34DRAFT_622490 [Phlyctochytrium arcticum]